MNLIEELGLEKCKAIVDGSPYWATTYCTAYAAYGATFHWYGACKNCYELPALCTAIANHDLTVSNSSQNDKQIDLSIKSDIEDHCTDIGNHISPLTRVIER